MQKSKAITISISAAFIVLILLSGIPSAQAPQEEVLEFTSTASHVSPHVQVYSSCVNGNQYLFVPVNSSGISVFPYWQIYLFGSGSFSLIVNNSVAETGVSVNSILISYTWNEDIGNRTSAVLNFQGINYTFDDILSGPLNDQIIQSVYVTSELHGQNQILAAESNVSGDLMYPTWTASFHSTQKLNFSIYLGRKMIRSGLVLGNKNVTFNVSGSVVTVQIILGGRTYNFPNELISTVPIEKYYGPKPPAALYTYSQYEIAIAKGFVAAIFGVAVAMFSGRKYVIEKEKREAFFI
ncbi:hypothetical protein ACNF42_08315 [Cuniculiplasma sp. SKW3]|uniref:hypothetical protein n=1 Tax=Cuniculiplasma sp. SKW3 TaxID=3400170 RepID=UPI003FD2D008